MATDKQANYSIYLTDEVKLRLKIMAAKRKAHLSTIIREALEAYLERKQ